MNLTSIAPYLAGVGTMLISIDEDQTGADDFAGQLLLYLSTAITDIGEGGALPPLPDAIKTGLTGKISSTARVILMIPATVLAIAQFQVTGTLAKVFRYISQALSLLLAGQSVPPPPTV